jgi:DNA polymerase-3 subunit epsilon
MSRQPGWLKNRPMFFLDLETTGLDPLDDEILQIGVVSLDGAKEWNMIVKPDDEAKALKKAEILRMSDSGPKKWATGRTQAFAMNWLAEMVLSEECMLAGHNVAKFDWPFIQTTCSRLGLPAPKIHYHLVCTASLAWPLVVHGELESLSLANLCDLLGISNEGAHTALVDAKRARECYFALMRRYEPKRLPG